MLILTKYWLTLKRKENQIFFTIIKEDILQIFSVDQRGCITRPKLMSRFTKIKNFGASASVLSYAHFQAFKFPDSMEVHFQCTIQICRYQCPDQCADSAQNLLHGDGLLLENHRASIGHADVGSYGISPPPLPMEAYLHQVIFF